MSASVELATPSRLGHSHSTSAAADVHECLTRQPPPRRVLVITTAFPSCVQPTRGVFVKERIRAIADLPGYEVRVVAPIPYFPPLRWFPRWYAWSQFPRTEVVDGLPVVRPRFFLPPKIGGAFQPGLMYRAVRRAVERIRVEFDFDLIDAHWVFPGGVVAARLARRYDRPVVITGRGEDMMRFPQSRFKGPQIRRALGQATQLIAVSREIAGAMQAEGGDPDRITVVPNGVDCETFRPMPQPAARSRLGLPPEARIILGVGDLLELKGFHLLVEALPELRRRNPDAFLVLVGGPGRFGRDYSRAIRERIAATGMSDHVLLAGRQAHDDLPLWYNAADVFALFSSREGSPNVLMEALACGLPAVATAVGGIPDVLEDARLGILLPERSVAAAAEGLDQALQARWDRQAIRRIIEHRDWNSTSAAVAKVFDRALAESERGQRVRRIAVP